METPPPSITVPFQLSLTEGRIAGQATVPSGLVTITQMLPSLQQLASNLINATVEAAAAQGIEISCRKGCGACCSQLVVISLFEAEFLANWIRSLPEIQQSLLRDRFHHALLSLKERGMLELLDPDTWGDSEEERQNLSMTYLSKKVPCPFLVEQSCGIYPIRPLICREYLVTTDPANCVAPQPGKVTVLPIPLRLSRPMYEIGARLEGSNRGWIPLVFLLAWMRGNMTPGDHVTGTGPELLHQVLSQLERADRDENAAD